MSNRFLKVAVFLLLFCPGLVVAQPEVTIDLAKSGDVKIKVKVDAVVSRIAIKNILPGGRYRTEVDVRELEEPVFSTVSFRQPVKPKKQDPIAMVSDPCKEAHAALKLATDEKQLPGIIAEISSGAKPTPEECFEVTKMDISGDWLIQAEQELVVTIERLEPTVKTWTYTLTTGLPGKWFTTYGFTFLTNQDRSYFAKQTTIPAVPASGTTPAKPESTVFKITEEEDREDLDFVPSILFHYKQPKTNWTWVAGLGYDLENIAAFVGGGYVVHQNVLITSGLVIHEQSDLAGRYNVGEDMKEAIDSAQLSSKSYGANLYLGVSFRFGSNIFSEREALQKETASAKAAAAERERQAAALATAAANEKEACIAKANAAQTTAKGGCTAAATEACASKPDPEKPGCVTAEEAKCNKKADDDAEAARAVCAIQPSMAEQAKLKLETCLKKAESQRAAEEVECLAKFPIQADSTQAVKDQAAACKMAAEKKETATKAECRSNPAT